MTTNPTAASFTKLNDGSWGIRITGEKARQLTKGVQSFPIKVSKKGGSSEMKTVTEVLWVGKDDRGVQVALCKVASDRPAGRSSGGTRSRPAWTGCRMGCREGAPNPRCKECCFDEYDN